MIDARNRFTAPRCCVNLRAVNEGHVWCGSDEWRAYVRDVSIPWALGDRDLGDDVLEIGPSDGATMDVFSQHAERLTVVEIDPELAHALGERFDGANVTIVEGDAVVARVRRPALHRCHVLPHAAPRPIARAAGPDLRRGVAWCSAPARCSSLRILVLTEVEQFHEGDTYLPLDPIEARLTRCGFVDVDLDVDTERRSWAARACARG